MKRKTVFGACFLAIAAVGCTSVAVSAAAPPEIGRCVRVAAKTGEYSNSRCKLSSPSEGNFEWLPGAGEQKKFTAGGSTTTLETVGGTKIVCEGIGLTGEYTGEKTATANLVLIGCENEATVQKCQTTPANVGQIETLVALEGEIGFITGGAKPTAGLDLKRSPYLLTFQCGQSLEGLVLVTVEGSVIATIKAASHMTEESRLLYKESAGKQIPEQFEGGVPDTLTFGFTAGLEKTTEAGALKVKGPVFVSNEEPIEIRLK